MMSLLRFELRKQLPFLLLVALLAVMNFAYFLLTESPHELSFHHSFDRGDLGDLWEQGLLYYFITMAFCSGLIMREYDERTIEFLDSLPLSRTKVLGAKILTGLVVLTILPLSELLFFFVTGRLSRDSLNPESDVLLLLSRFGQAFVLSYVLFGYALAVAHLRRFGWLLTAMAFWAIFALVRVDPSFSAFNPFLLGAADEFGSVALPPATVGHVLVSSACLVLTWSAFAGGRSRFQLWQERLAAVPWGRAVLVLGACSVAVAGVATVVMVFYESEEERPELFEEAGLNDLDWTMVQREIPGFSVSYTRSQKDRARALLAAAPEVRSRVEAFFGIPLEGTLRLDLTGSRQHTAGTTQWKHIKMGLESMSAAELRWVLGHELAHACMNLGGDGHLRDALFHEGLATFAEMELFNREAQANSRRVAATIWKWHELDFEILTDPVELGQEWDSDMIYPMGELFFAEVVAQNGRSAIRSLIETFAREPRSADLTAMERWRFVFQRAGIDLDAAIDGWNHRLRDLARRGQVVAARPPVGYCSVSDGFIFVQPPDREERFKVPEGWRIVCRLKPSEDASDLQFVGAALTEDESEDYFWVDEDYFPDGSFYYQLGYVREWRSVYGRWRRVRL